MVLDLHIQALCGTAIIGAWHGGELCKFVVLYRAASTIFSKDLNFLDFASFWKIKATKYQLEKGRDILEKGGQLGC